MYEAEFDRIVEAEKKAGCTVQFYSSEDVDRWADENCLKLRKILPMNLLKDSKFIRKADQLSHYRGRHK